MQAKELLGKSNSEIIKIIGELCRKDMSKTGILASVSIAQFCLESGYGKLELAQNANNCFGMKQILSGNTWDSVWDGTSIYTKETWEVEDGKKITIVADFRAYPEIEDSIADHSAYLVGAEKSKGKVRYAGIQGMTDYRKVAELIKAGGYATDPDYVPKLCKIIEQYNLTDYDYVYKVQVGSYSIKAGAEKLMNEIKTKGYNDAFIVEVPVNKK